MNELEAGCSTLIELVSEYSPSGSEAGAVQYLTARMAALGFTQAFSDEAGNAVGVMGNGPKQVILLGHIDTVPGEIPVRVEDGNLYGRGSVDAKAPLACFVEAVAQTGQVDGWQFVVIGAVEEERDSDGARFIAPRYHPDYAIIGEPNKWERVALGYKGSARADVTIRTDQFHSAHAAASASERAVDTWLQLKAFADTFNTGRAKMFDHLLLNLRSMDSGADGFTQWARLGIGARLPLDLPPEAWYAKLNEIASGASVETRGYAIPAWTCEKNSALVRALLGGIRAQGGNPSFVYKSGTADLNIVAPAWNCPAAVYGPGDSALDHTPEEHIALVEYQHAVSALAGALRSLTATSAT